MILSGLSLNIISILSFLETVLNIIALKFLILVLHLFNSPYPVS